MQEKLEQIRKKVMSQIKDISSLRELEDFRISVLGKKGELTQILKAMGGLSPEERPKIGQIANDVREFIETFIENKKNEISTAEQQRKLKEEVIDITIPGRKRELGHYHPMTLVIDDIKRIFIGMGYEIAEGPDIETDYYNFAALNIPENHPAKDEQDTFYVEGGFMLRTSTSPVQVRVMENGKLPIKIIAPGKVFRSDEVDATHSPVFHQLEGLVVDKGITMGDLKGALSVFAKELFGEGTKVRFRPHYFPFTEPSAEMDASCFACGGKGCRVCKDSGWIELLGCGMVHPKVLKQCGIDPEMYSGFAFGMGLERVAMQKYNITDMRILFENNMNFLTQF